MKTSPDQPMQALPIPQALLPDQLTMRCDRETLSFDTTDDLPALQDVIGQPRAIHALELGSEVTGVGYNIFVIGLPDSGRTTLTREFLRQKAAQETVPNDWCYVNNFDKPRQPKAIQLPAGMAAVFSKDMQSIIDLARVELRQRFTSDEYVREHDRLLSAMQKKLETAMHNLEKLVTGNKFQIVKTPYGFFVAPAVDGKPLDAQEVEQLSDENKQKLRGLQEKLSKELEKVLARVQKIQSTAKEQIKELNQRTSAYVITPLIDQLKRKYTGLPTVISYLDRVQADLIHHTEQFNEQKETRNPLQDKEWRIRYKVNVLVDNTDLLHAPVIMETQPTYHNLLGSIEHEFILGVSHTDFTMIRPGALHRANGGYLVVPARDVLLNPYAWEGLKRILRDNEIRMLELGGQIGLISTASLDPDPIPLKIKVIMVGTPLLYYLLRAHDEDFGKLFKVRAEFATEMDRTAESEFEYALFVKSVVDANHLLSFESGAVEKIITYSSRLAENQEKLSARFGMVTDLIRESNYWARKSGLKSVSSEAVQQAIDEKIYRSNLVEERLQEMIKKGSLMIDVSGEAVGQVNALSVSFLGDYFFGHPNRVTASVYAGKAGVIDIERQAKLGGATHTKGVLIISGLLGARYGQSNSLNLTASITFEQSYSEIEGDSASMAELLAILSALSGLPLKQELAVTGSINQHGVIQAVGGVNQKIEGFFQCCKAKGLTGSQGVIIPAANRRNLVLKDEVIEAVRQGMFRIISIEKLDEAIQLLSGLEVGELQEDGLYLEDTFNYAVVKRLAAFSRLVRRDIQQAGEDT